MTHILKREREISNKGAIECYIIDVLVRYYTIEYVKRNSDLQKMRSDILLRLSRRFPGKCHLSSIPEALRE